MIGRVPQFNRWRILYYSVISYHQNLEAPADFLPLCNSSRVHKRREIMSTRFQRSGYHIPPFRCPPGCAVVIDRFPRLLVPGKQPVGCGRTGGGMDVWLPPGQMLLDAADSCREKGFNTKKRTRRPLVIAAAGGALRNEREQCPRGDVGASGYDRAAALQIADAQRALALSIKAINEREGFSAIEQTVMRKVLYLQMIGRPRTVSIIMRDGSRERLTAVQSMALAPGPM
ncbi:hypothetical protein HOY80DRAFT_316153 [Tuber brumale]|nr:hypothetical protein HOY80DRAFT_316153 [Tuber brumale]